MHCMAKNDACDSDLIEFRIRIEKKTFGEPAYSAGETNAERPFLLEQVASMSDLRVIDGVPSHELCKERRNSGGSD